MHAAHGGSPVKQDLCPLRVPERTAQRAQRRRRRPPYMSSRTWQLSQLLMHVPGSLRVPIMKAGLRRHSPPLAQKAQLPLVSRQPAAGGGGRGGGGVAGWVRLERRS